MEVVCLFTINSYLDNGELGSQPGYDISYLEPVGLTESIGCFLANGQTQSGVGEGTAQLKVRVWFN